MDTFPRTDIAPENRFSQKESSFATTIFSEGKTLVLGTDSTASPMKALQARAEPERGFHKISPSNCNMKMWKFRTK